MARPRKRRARAPRKPRRNPLDCPGYRAWILGNIERDIAARAAAARRINADGATLH